MTINRKVIVALDSSNFKEINKILDLIKDHIFGVKIGYEFFFKFGLEGYKKIQNKNINIFLDLKLHDIPNTVKKGIGAINLLKLAICCISSPPEICIDVKYGLRLAIAFTPCLIVLGIS